MIKEDYNAYHRQYNKKLVMLRVDLNKDKDKDIIEALDNGESRQSEAKRLIRIGMGKI